MDNISSFLERFKKLLTSKSAVTQEVLDAIKTHTGVSLDKTQINIQNNVVFVQTTPMVKSTIFIKKVPILQTLKERIGQHVMDIR